ncbi:hypothetical protein ACMFMG_008389 [Clarireedia jacksonii]
MLESNAAARDPSSLSPSSKQVILCEVCSKRGPKMREKSILDQLPLPVWRESQPAIFRTSELIARSRNEFSRPLLRPQARPATKRRISTICLAFAVIDTSHIREGDIGRHIRIVV